MSEDEYEQHEIAIDRNPPDAIRDAEWEYENDKED